MELICDSLKKSECLKITNDACILCGFSLCQQCIHHQNNNFKKRHDTVECEDFQKLRQNHPADLAGLFNLVFPYRFLRLKFDQPNVYKRIIALESHLEERTQQVSYQIAERNVKDCTNYPFTYA